MKNQFKLTLILVLISILFLTNISLAKAADKGLEGIWQGNLDVGGEQVRIVIKISKNDEGILVATMDSPDQGAFDIPADSVSFDNQVIVIEFKALKGMYEGKINEEFLKIEGSLSQSGYKIPLDLEKQLAPVSNRPQEPKRPFPYDEEEVVVFNEKENVKLAGTLTTPKGEGPFPAVILISGSGLQDRDETILGHKPFLVLSDYLTRLGIAVLRVDDRGYGGSTGNPLVATTENFATDVEAEFVFLQKHPKIDSKQIGLIGHSEGGIIAPMVAAKSDEIAFAVLMAGTGLPGSEISAMQNEISLRASGISEEDLNKTLELNSKLYNIATNDANLEVAEKQIRALLREHLETLPAEQKNQLGDLNKYIDQQVTQLLLPWTRFFFSYDPRPTLMEVKCPVLAFNGDKDTQVPASVNLLEIEKALKAGGNKDYKIMELPGLNHLFQTANTGYMDEYARIKETISPTVLKIIGEWILEHTSR